jgi:bacteriorhodopsin
MEQIQAATEMASYHGVVNGGTVLGPHDVVGTTFFIACNMMLAFTGFFFVQVGQVPKQWKTSLSVAMLVTGIAFYNYTYMKSQWVQYQSSPTNYRYTDWLVTVPLQITEFYFILKSGGAPVSSGLGLRMFLASIAMVFSGWLAEICFFSKVVGFVLGCSFWLYIVYETFAGEAAGLAGKLMSNASKQAFSTLRLIVSVGWCIYPLGFFIQYLSFIDPTKQTDAPAPLNILYNLADLINKGAFGLCVWSAAANDTEQGLRAPLNA